MASLPSILTCDTAEILLVGYRFHPLDVLAVQRFLDGDMRHRRGGGGAMPMLVLPRAPDHVPGADFDLLFAFTLSPAAPGSHDQGLPEWMRMPVGACTRFECDRSA